MTLFYALLIFFGAMTPSDYATKMNTTFSSEVMNQTLQANQSIFNSINAEQDAAARLRAIDRTEGN